MHDDITHDDHNKFWSVFQQIFISIKQQYEPGVSKKLNSRFAMGQIPLQNIAIVVIRGHLQVAASLRQTVVI